MTSDINIFYHLLTSDSHSGHGFDRMFDRYYLKQVSHLAYFM